MISVRNWLLVGAIIANVVMAGYLMFRTPDHININTMQLSRVRWYDGEGIDHLRGRRVIAIAFCNDVKQDADTGAVVGWSTVRIGNDPNQIDRIVNALLRAERKDRSFSFISMQFMFVICDDNTGVRIPYMPDFDAHDYYGPDWRSKELWNIFTPRLSTGPSYWPGLTTQQTLERQRQFEKQRRDREEHVKKILATRKAETVQPSTPGGQGTMK